MFWRMCESVNLLGNEIGVKKDGQKMLAGLENLSVGLELRNQSSVSEIRV